MKTPLLLLLTAALPLALGEITECGPDSTAMVGNPLGTCVCDGHLWFGDDCNEAFYCLDRDGNGCYKVENKQRKAKDEVKPICLLNVEMSGRRICEPRVLE